MEDVPEIAARKLAGAPVEFNGILSDQVPVKFVGGELHSVSSHQSSASRSKQETKQDPGGKAALQPVSLQRPLLTKVSIVPVDQGEILQHPRQRRVDLDLRGSKW